MNSESANRFIAALVKSLQTLCHGYVEFDDGIEIIGHLYLNIDSGSTFDYVLKEKVCKNAENSTVFLSKSFHAEGKPENTLIRSDKDLSHDDEQTPNIGDNGMSPSGTTRLQSAITNISNVLSGSTDHHSTHSPVPLNTVRRKRDHNGSYSNQHNLSYKYTTLQSSSSSAMPYFSNSVKQHSSSRDGSKHYNAPQSEFFGGDSNQSSAMGAEDEEDLHLDVTFVKEEYGDRQRAGHASRAHQSQSSDPSSNQSNMMPENNASSGGYPMGYHQGAQAQQPFAGSGGGGGGGEMSTLNQSFQDPSHVDTGHLVPPPPNPRTHLVTSNRPSFDLNNPESSRPSQSIGSRGHNVIHTIRQNKWAVTRARDDATAGPPQRMPDGVKPLCGYVHPDDVKKWMMYELLPGSGVYIHQENYNVVLSKTRQDRPDGKAMARYLMSCFWRQSELVGASIAEPPKPHQRSLDRGIIHAILGFCQHHSRELSTDIRRTIQQKIGYAKFYFVKKTHDPDSPKTPAAISAEASPRRMSMEMARRNSAGIPIEGPIHQPQGKRGRRASEVITYSRADDLIRMPPRVGSSELPRPSSASMDMGPRLSMEDIPGRLESSSAADMSGLGRMTESMSDRPFPPTDMSSRSSAEISSRIASDISNRMLTEMNSRIPNDLSSRLIDLPARMMASEMASRMSEDVSRAVEVGSTTDLVNRISGSVPAGMSRGFLDMLNNMYPNN